MKEPAIWKFCMLYNTLDTHSVYETEKFYNSWLCYELVVPNEQNTAAYVPIL
jgi:hypothetical protein